MGVISNRAERRGMDKTLLTSLLVSLALIVTGCPKKLTQEEKAIRLVKESETLGGNTTVRLRLDQWLEEQGDRVRPIGWNVTQKSDQVYLVSYKYRVYSFGEGTGERGFFFEVNLDTEAVRNVTKEVARKMVPLSLPFKDEKQIPEKLMQQLEEESKMFSGERS